MRRDRRRERRPGVSHSTRQLITQELHNTLRGASSKWTRGVLEVLREQPVQATFALMAQQAAQ